MATEPIAGGVGGALSGGDRSRLPHDVGRVLSYLAHLLDGEIALRVDLSAEEFAAAHLGVGRGDVVTTTAALSGLGFQLAALTLGRVLETHPAVALVGETQSDAPRYEMLELGAERLRIPNEVTAAFAAGAVAPCPLVVALIPEDFRDRSVLSVHSRTADAGAARAWLDGLLERSRRDNPFRGRALEAVATPGGGLRFRIVDSHPAARADVVLPAAVWGEVDRNVHGLFAALDRLAAAGLAENRGVLLAGPPGTGKTLLTRVLAAEVPAGVTVVFCDGKAVANSVRTLYAELEHLAPALVVMEDIDLVVADRRRGGGLSTEALIDFLLALDGAISRHRGVVTVATTNDPAAIDAAAKRAARFDRVVDVPPPDAAARAAILARYLRSLPGSVDVARVAAATHGATGADLRELVTLAVLHTSRPSTAGGGDDGGEVGTDLLLRLAADAGYRVPTGQYL